MASASMLTHGQNNRCAFLFFPFYHKLTINHQFFDIFLSPTVKQPLNISLYRGIKIRARSTIYTHNFNIFNMVFFTVLYLHKIYFILTIRPLFFCKISKMLRSNISHKCTGFIFFRMMIFESTFFLTAF